MPGAIEILPAETGDLAGILEVQRAAFMQEAERIGDFDIAPLHQTLAGISEDYKQYQFFKAADGGRIVGTVKARISENGECWLGRLAVLPEYHRRGIGRSLVSFAERQFPDALKFVLFTEPDNTRALNLYYSLGYKLSGDSLADPRSGLRLVELTKDNRQTDRS
ncbi:MAG: GNAT family N-acetyltransferase [Alistipes sp.]|nr:GNAT family N-acetyltransferase [Alistipes sp.]